MPLEALPAALAQAAHQQQQQGQQEAPWGGTAPAGPPAMPVAGVRAALPAGGAAGAEIMPLDDDPQLAQQQQWGYAQQQQDQQQQQQQWHSLVPPQQVHRAQAGRCAGQQAGVHSGSYASPAGPSSGQLGSAVTSSRGVQSSQGVHSSRGMHSSRGVHSARSSRSTQSSSSMGGCDGGQWDLQSTLLLLSPGELQLELDACGQPVMLGHGRAAAVCLGRLGDKAVAVKAYELRPGLRPESAWRQVTKTRGCCHPRVAELQGTAIQGRLLLLATELLPLGSLREALQHRELRRELRWSSGGYQVAVDVAEALVFLHTQLRLRHGGLSSRWGCADTTTFLLHFSWVRTCTSSHGGRSSRWGCGVLTENDKNAQAPFLPVARYCQLQVGVCWHR
jgi:hypothetical protein